MAPPRALLISAAASAGTTARKTADPKALFRRK
jgi:hypothetical protein